MPLLARLLIIAAPLALAATAVHSDVVISSNATLNVSCSAGVCSPTAANAVLNVTDLENMLASGNVDVTTTGSGVQANDIQITSSFSWSSANSLALDAYQSVLFEQPVAVDGSGAVSLTTNDGGSGGMLLFNPGGNLEFTQTTNVLSINGQQYILEKSLSALAKVISNNPSGFFALSQSSNAHKHGPYKHSPVSTIFSGSVNGLGNSIKDVTIETGDENAGLFEEIAAGGSVSSLVLENVTLKFAEALKASDNAGGLAGLNYGTLFNDYASGRISARVRYVLQLGGLVGMSEGNILGCSSGVSLSLVGDKHETDFVSAGSLVGDSQGAIETSFAVGDIKARNIAVPQSGGLAGVSSSIENSYSTGSTTFPGAQSGDMGGLAGSAGSMITASYSTGTPSATQSFSVGGLVGYDGTDGGLSSDYWDTTTSGITNLSQGAGNISNDPGITGDTTAQLQSGLPSGFDPSIWAEDSNINNGLPYLIDNPPRN